MKIEQSEEGGGSRTATEERGRRALTGDVFAIIRSALTELTVKRNDRWGYLQSSRLREVQLVPLHPPLSLQELHTTKLPSVIDYLSNLEILELEGSMLEMLPASLSDLGNLKVLRLVNCKRLKFLPGSIGLLTELEVKSCRCLVEVGTLPEKIDGLCGLARLQKLNIIDCRALKELPRTEILVSLEELRASHCGRLKRMRGLAHLTKLRLLDVSGCNEIEELEGVEHLRLLEKLDAYDCPNLRWDGRVLEQLPHRLREGMLYI